MASRPPSPAHTGPRRTFDVPILRWVGYHEYATVQQVVHRFWIQRGVGGKYGYRCVAKLVEEGALSQRLLEPGGDNSTPRIVSLAPHGYHLLGLPPERPYSGATLESHIRHRIQGAEVMLERAPQGWKAISKHNQEALVAAIRRHALKRFRGRALDSHAAHLRTRFERISPKNLSLPVSIFWHSGREDVRLFLPVRRGVSYKRHLEKVRGLGFLRQVSFEAICSDPDLLRGARQHVQRWGRREKVAVEVHCVPDFRVRLNPIRYHERRRSGEANSTK